MFFIASKILGVCTKPVLWVLALLLIAVCSRNALRRKRILIATIVLLFVFSNNWLLNVVTRQWELTQQIHSGHYTAVVVLGGYSKFDYRNQQLDFNDNADRLLNAIALKHAGLADYLVISGGSGNMANPDEREARLTLPMLLQYGIDTTHVLVEDQSKNTSENIRHTKTVLAQKGLQPPYILVTSAFHMRRTLAICKKEGLDVVPHCTNLYQQTAPHQNWDYYIIPDLRALFGWERLSHEWLGMLSYKLTGKI